MVIEAIIDFLSHSRLRETSPLAGTVSRKCRNKEKSTLDWLHMSLTITRLTEQQWTISYIGSLTFETEAKIRSKRVVSSFYAHIKGERDSQH